MSQRGGNPPKPQKRLYEAQNDATSMENKIANCMDAPLAKED